MVYLPERVDENVVEIVKKERNRESIEGLDKERMNEIGSE